MTDVPKKASDAEIPKKEGDQGCFFMDISGMYLICWAATTATRTIQLSCDYSWNLLGRAWPQAEGPRATGGIAETVHYNNHQNAPECAWPKTKRSRAAGDSVPPGPPCQSVIYSYDENNMTLSSSNRIDRRRKIPPSQNHRLAQAAGTCERTSASAPSLAPKSGMTTIQ